MIGIRFLYVFSPVGISQLIREVWFLLPFVVAVVVAGFGRWYIFVVAVVCCCTAVGGVVRHVRCGNVADTAFVRCHGAVSFRSFSRCAFAVFAHLLYSA